MHNIPAYKIISTCYIYVLEDFLLYENIKLFCNDLLLGIECPIRIAIGENNGNMSIP